MTRYSDNFAAAGITTMDQVGGPPSMCDDNEKLQLIAGCQTGSKPTCRAWDHAGGPPEEDQHLHPGDPRPAECEREWRFPGLARERRLAWWLLAVKASNLPTASPQSHTYVISCKLCHSTARGDNLVRFRLGCLYVAPRALQSTQLCHPLPSFEAPHSNCEVLLPKFIQSVYYQCTGYCPLYRVLEHTVTNMSSLAWPHSQYLIGC